MRCAGKSGVVTGASRGLEREILLDDPTVLRRDRRPRRGACRYGGRLSGEADRPPARGRGGPRFLVTDDSSFVYGTPILVDGKLTAEIY
jgi:hypothetical protein